MPKTHLPAFFLQTSWPILIKCCMIRKHIDIGFFKKKNVSLGKPMVQNEGEIHPFSAVVEGCKVCIKSPWTVV